jgi:hypothetical protein
VNGAQFQQTSAKMGSESDDDDLDMINLCFSRKASGSTRATGAFRILLIDFRFAQSRHGRVLPRVARRT